MALRLAEELEAREISCALSASFEAQKRFVGARTSDDPSERNGNLQQGSEGLNLERALGALLRRAPLILLCFVLAAGAAFVFSKLQTKKYTTASSLAFSSNPLSQQIAGLSPSSSSSLLVQQANDIELVRLGEMAAKTASVLGHGLTAEKVSASLSISGRGESGVVEVSATATSPSLAAAIANTYAGEFVRDQQGANRDYFRSALTLVKRQLEALTRAQRVGADGLALQNRAQTLALLSELQYGNVQVAQEASVPTSPSAPRTSRNTLIGGALGLLIGLGLAFVFEQLDPRVRKSEDLESIYQLPLLGIVPESGALSSLASDRGSTRALLRPAEAEAFSLIRAHLRFFNVDRELRTVLITSAAPGDGKTSIALHLAGAAARIGSRVLLLEMDLRQPALARQLDIQSGPGLADVLVGDVPMDEATQSIDLGVLPGEGANSGRTLDVLAAGAVLPPNPGELIESHAMDAVLEQARSLYDLVVLDTPPLTAVSDAFPLLNIVDGVVIVSRLRRSKRDAAERLRQVLASSGAPVLGIIANGAKSSEPTTPYVAKPDSTVASSNGASPSPTPLEPTIRT
jgi:capsular exopolysaccharide synthesis family protein